MTDVISIQFSIHYPVFVTSQDTDMGGIDVEGPVTSDKTIILTQLINGLHRASQDINLDFAVVKIEYVHIILFS